MVRAVSIDGTRSDTTTNSSPPMRASVSSGAQEALQPRGDELQEPVAGGVAEAIVDQLEVVEVEVDHRDEPGGADGCARASAGAARAGACGWPAR